MSDGFNFGGGDSGGGFGFGGDSSSGGGGFSFGDDKKEDTKKSGDKGGVSFGGFEGGSFGSDDKKGDTGSNDLGFQFGSENKTTEKTDKKNDKKDSGGFSMGGDDKKDSGFGFSLDSKTDDKKSDGGGFSLDSKSDGGFGFGGDDKKDGKKEDSGFGFGDKKNEKPKTVKSTLPSEKLDSKTLQELVTQWNAELLKDVADFNNLSQKIAKWDQIVYANDDKVGSLAKQIQDVEKQQKDLELNLQAIEGTQSTLGKLLDDCEPKIAKLYQEAKKTSGDLDREGIYKKAEDINAQLDSMSDQLKKMISTLNETFEESSGESENQMNDIVQVINCHLNTLQWIEVNTNQLSTQVGKLKPQENTSISWNSERTK